MWCLSSRRWVVLLAKAIEFVWTERACVCAFVATPLVHKLLEWTGIKKRELQITPKKVLDSCTDT